MVIINVQVAKMIGIYRIENLINNKNYIGKSIQIEVRWKKHKNLAYNTLSCYYNYPLYKAIRKYGINNFKFSIIEECNEDELDIKECYWIKYYQSFGPQGYNQNAGGGGNAKALPNEVITLFNNGNTVDDICDILSVKKQTILNILHPLGLGYMTQEEKNQLQPECHAVEQYDLNGNLLNTYFSAGAAAEAVSSTRPAVSSACHNHTLSKNFVWKFVDDPTNVLDIINNYKAGAEQRKKSVTLANIKRCAKKVNQYDLNGNYIKTFISACEAGRSLGKRHGNISAVCCGKGKTAHGFIWRYVSDEYPEGQNLNSGGGG